MTSVHTPVKSSENKEIGDSRRTTIPGLIMKNCFSNKEMKLVKEREGTEREKERERARVRE